MAAAAAAAMNPSTALMIATIASSLAGGFMGQMDAQKKRQQEKEMFARSARQQAYGTAIGAEQAAGSQLAGQTNQTLAAMQRGLLV